jgi:hypothetical protein
MAKDNVIQFPKSIEKEKRLKMKQARVDEIQLENDWLSADIEHLQKTLEGNINEMQKLLLELAELYKLEVPELIKKEFQFENEWGDDFEFTPDFDLDDNPEEDK